jgi:hypothetical protein
VILRGKSSVRGKKAMTNVTFFKANHTPVQYRGHEEAEKNAEEANDDERGFRETAARYWQAGLLSGLNL